MKRTTEPMAIQSLQTTKLNQSPSRLRASCAMLACLLAGTFLALNPVTSRAQNGTWTANASSTWITSGNWSGGIVASGTNAIANFSTINITANRTVTVDAGRVIGEILLGDITASQSWIFSGGPLILESTNGIKPQLRASGGATANIFNTQIQGTSGLRKEQANLITLNASNIWSGDTEINRGTLALGNANAIPNGPGKGNVIMQFVGGNPTLDILTVNPTINGLNSTTPLATVTSSSAAGTTTLTVGAGDANGEFGGAIANGVNRVVALTKIGAGTQTLTNANTYTGATTINGGKLSLVGNGSISGSTAVNLGAGGTLDVAGVDFPPYGINTALNGTGTTGTIEGGLNLNFGATMGFSYAGNAAPAPRIDVASGTLTLADNNTTVTVTGGPLKDGSYKLISKSGSGLVAGTVAGTLAIEGLGIVGGGTPALAISGDELFLNITGGVPVLEWGSGDGTWADGTSGWNSGGSTLFTNGNAALLSDDFSTGNPTLTLNTTVLPQSLFAASTNHYTISGTGNIGGSAELRKLDTGALTLDVTNTYTGGSTLFAGTINLRNPNSLGDASSVLTINGGALDNTSGNPLTLADHPQTWSGNFTFAGSSPLNLGSGAITMTAARTITVNASTLTVPGDISGSFGLNKSGVGILELSGNNAFTGTLTINDGEVIVNSAGALNSTTPVPVSFQTDTDVKGLSLNGNSITIRNPAMGVIGGGTATYIRNNHASTPVTLTINSTSDSQYAGTITDGGAAPLSLTKIGASIWTFGGGSIGAGTYSGDTTISAGTVRCGANNIFPFGAGKGNMIVNGTLDILDRSAMALNGLSGSGIVNRSDDGNTAFNSTLTIGHNDASGTFSGRIRTTDATASMSLVKTGTGTQILSGNNNDYVGLTTISDGILQIGDGGLTGSITVSTSIVNNASLVFNRDGVMTYAGVITGSGPLTNNGPGIVNLTGVSTYTGVTIVNAGTLRVNGAGSLPTTTTVTVNSGGAIGGTGKILGPVFVQAGGGVAPGASVGTLTISNNLSLALDSTNVFEINLDTLAADQVVGLSNVIYGGTLVLTNVAGLNSATNGATLKLFDAQTYIGLFQATDLPVIPNRSWDISNLALNGTVSLVYNGSTTPTNVTFAQTGPDLEISWPASHTGWRLQGQTNAPGDGINGNWFNVPGSPGTNQMFLTIDPANGSSYFRLVYP